MRNVYSRQTHPEDRMRIILAVPLPTMVPPPLPSRARLPAVCRLKTCADPQRHGCHFSETFAIKINILEKTQSSDTANQQDASRSSGVLVRQEEQILQRLRDNLASSGRWKKRTPFIALFGLFLALGLIIAQPRFMVANDTACAVLGGEWLRGPESGKEACVFYAG